MALFIPPEKISEIQSNLNVFDVISDYIPLKRKGQNFIGLCPFHHEKTPSFTVNIEKQIYKCFGCGEGGTIFNFLMKQESLSFPEAVNVLAKKANVRISDLSSQEKSNGISALYEANDQAARFFSEMLLKAPEAKGTKDYLLKRSINSESVRKFRLGYSPNRWDSITNKTKDWNISTQSLERAGLIIKRQERGYYDRFRNKLMFPIIDLQSRPIGFGARALDNSLPKYLNSPETPIFNKSKTLYGINLAKDSIAKERKVLIMEGYTDVIMAHQCGIDWSIAVLGTALTREHVRTLRRYCEKAILVFDSDKAGQKSSERNLDTFIEEDFDVSIVLLPDDYDPYDFLVEKGKQKFLERVERAYDFFSFKIKLAESKWDMSTVSGKSSAIDDILLVVKKIPDVLKRELTIKKVAEETSIEENILRKRLFELLKKDSPGRKVPYNNTKPNTNKQKPDANQTVEKNILSIMINRNDLIEKVEKEIGLDSFVNENLSDIATRVSGVYSQKGKVEFSDISPILSSSDMSGDLIDIILKQNSSEKNAIVDQAKNAEKVLDECIRFVKKRKIKEGLKQTRKKMFALNNKDSIQEVDELLTNFHKKNMDFHSMRRSV